MGKSLPNADAQLRIAIDEAAHWFVKLQACEGPSDVRNDWQQWLGASPQNRSAWARVQTVQQRFAAVPGFIGLPALTEAGLKRRRALQLVVAGTVAAPLSWWMAGSQPWVGWTADFTTAKGEIKPFTLPDGSRIVLDTDSAVDIAFDRNERKLILDRGEIYIKTAVDPARRPFIVQTRHGQVQALGTEFVVQVDRQGSQVMVNEHAVRISPRGARDAAVQVDAGYGTTFSTHAVARPEVLPGAVFAPWQHGSFMAMELPMGQLVDKLKTYRPGYLGIDPALSGIKVSGVFPLAHTDRALAALENTYPVRIRQFTRYWTWIEPRG